MTSYRLGKPKDKPRPLKVILENRTQRKFLLQNTKHTPDKTPLELQDVIVRRDLTPSQSIEKRQFVQNKIKKKSKGKKHKQGDEKTDTGSAQEEVMEIQGVEISPFP